MLNPFFLQGSKTEQGLVQDLINEQLRMYGVEIYYLPRRYVTTNTIIKEVVQSEFTNYYPIEAYVDSYEGYGGQGTILSKFGIENLDDLTLIISQERYGTYISPLIENIPNIELSTRPKEGDLIYFPLGDRLFEIKYVEHEQPFYQLQKNYVYTLRCSLFRYEDEVINTGVDFIDDEIDQLGYIQTLTLIGAGRTAEAVATMCAEGAVTQVHITNMGNGYRKQPIIGFSSAPAGGVTAVGIASITTDYIGCNGFTNTGKIEAIDLINPGCGYTIAPWVTIQARDGDTGVGAAATASIGSGSISGIITVTDGGSGYTTNPHVIFDAPIPNYPTYDVDYNTFDQTGYTFDNQGPVGFQSAYGYGVINAAGIVTAVYVSYAGVGYALTATPSVIIAPPTGIGATIGIGTFVFNEIVEGQTSGTQARVKKWTVSDSELEVSIVDGTFTPGEIIIGAESGAIYAMREQEVDDLVDEFADNDTFETEADDILDFSETNPFGMP